VPNALADYRKLIDKIERDRKRKTFGKVMQAVLPADEGDAT
jgi:hypothetical protein